MDPAHEYWMVRGRFKEAPWLSPIPRLPPRTDNMWVANRDAAERFTSKEHAKQEVEELREKWKRMRRRLGKITYVHVRVYRSVETVRATEREQYLYREHGKLVERKFTEGLNEGERARLQQIRSLLDEIEMAKPHPGLDALEELERSQRKLADEIHALVDELRKHEKEAGKP